MIVIFDFWRNFYKPFLPCISNFFTAKFKSDSIFYPELHRASSARRAARRAFKLFKARALHQAYQKARLDFLFS